MSTLNPDKSCGVQDISHSELCHHTHHTQSILTVKIVVVARIVDVIVLHLFLSELFIRDCS